MARRHDEQRPPDPVAPDPCAACGSRDCPYVDDEQCVAVATLTDARRRFEGRTLDGLPVEDA